MNPKEKISLLRHQQAHLQKEMNLIANKIKDIDAEIKTGLLTEPACSSCGRHRLKEDMIIVTQDVINDHRDSGEGYGCLSLGEYYCGC